VNMHRMLFRGVTAAVAVGGAGAVASWWTGTVRAVCGSFPAVAAKKRRLCGIQANMLANMRIMIWLWVPW
jgi:hypothetical protein